MDKQPHITVATIVPRKDEFLMVEELQDGVKVYNQPAGHLEFGESLIDAAIRETFEETNWIVKITHLLGIYHYIAKSSEIHYIRHCFIAEPMEENIGQALDPDILSVVWLNHEQITKRADKLRSPLVLSNIDDYLRGHRFPLTVENTIV
jgi:ADP-ribose pyrophosphatase YjhB (NUDIX family)